MDERDMCPSGRQGKPSCDKIQRSLTEKNFEAEKVNWAIKTKDVTLRQEKQEVRAAQEVKKKKLKS